MRGVVRNSDYGYPRIGRGGSPILEPGVVRESDPHVEQYTQEQQQPESPSSSSPPVNLKASTARRGVVVASPLQVKKTKRAEETRPEHLPEDQALLRDLVAAGVSRHVAHQLVRKYPQPDIEIQLSALRFRNATEPAAILVQAIKESWAMPRALEEAKRKEAQEAQCRAEREAAERVRIAEEQARQEREERTNACIEAMNVGERRDLERMATTQIRGEGPVWRDREIPRAVLNATMRSIVAERLGRSGGHERV